MMLLLQIWYPTVTVNSIAVLEIDHSTTVPVVISTTERSGFPFSAFLCPCKAHGSLTYILKILNLQFGPSWLRCALHQPAESLCHGTRGLSAGEVSHCSSLAQILR